MKTISLKICLLLLLSLTFCSKDSSKEQVQNQEIDNYEFEELGSDAPYIYGQSYNGRNAYTTYYPGNIPIKAPIIPPRRASHLLCQTAIIPSFV